MATGDFAEAPRQLAVAESERPETVSGESESETEFDVPSPRNAFPADPPGDGQAPGLLSQLQAKLAVGSVDDAHEREADQVADRVVRGLKGGSGWSPGAGGERISRRAQPKGGAGVGPDGGQLDGDVEQRLGSARGGGQPLDAGVQRSMEGAIGADFSGVRVHTGSQAEGLNNDLNARAFTVGQDIFFRDGVPDASSASGAGLLAHELTHTVQQGNTGVSRLFGFGNKGRTKADEEEIIAQKERSPKAVAKSLHRALQKGIFKSQHTRFNKVMQMLTTPSVGDIAKEYEAAQKKNLGAAIGELFGAASFRTQYLHNVIAHKGFPDTEHRVRLALGLAGANSQGMVADQEEATRLFQTLSAGAQKALFGAHKAEFKAGMSSKGFAQIEALVQSSTGQEALVNATSPRPESSGPPPVGEQKQATVNVLVGFDNELAMIVARGLKAESTAFFDALTIRASADVAQMAGEVKGWVERAKKAEEVFPESGVIRKFVLGWKVTLTTPDGTKYSALNKKQAFINGLFERTFKHGWNPADRLYISGLVAGGLGGKLPQAPAARGGPPPVVPKDDKAVEALVLQAIGRATTPAVIAALTAIRGELAILKDGGAKNCRSRIRDELGAIPPEASFEFLAAITNLAVPKDDWDDQDQANQERKLRVDGVPIAARIFKAVKLEDKHIQQFTGKLGHGKDATPGYLEVRRYAFKKSFKTGKFLRRVSNLTSDERQLARKDTVLRDRVREKLKKRPTDLDQVEAIIGWGSLPAPPVKWRSESDREDAKKAEEHKDWARRWGLLIAGSKDQKKIYNFALAILDAGDGKDAYLHAVRDHLAPDHKAKLVKTKLGKAMIAGTPIGTGGFDLVGEIIGKSKTARPKGSANVDAICQSFESLNGKMLLTEWTNIDEIGGAGSVLEARKKVLEEVTNFWMTANLEDEQQLGKLHKQLGFLNDLGRSISGSTLITLREDRRKHLNSGLSQLMTAEYQTVRERHAAKVASAIKSDDAFRQALLDKGLMPNELAVVGAQVLFVADQAKQSNLDTWHQWALFTNRGQLRKESAGLLTGRMTSVQNTAAKGGNSSKEEEEFAAQRAELKSRTKAFVDTANAYKDRLKKVIDLILSAIIVVATAGIGGVGVIGMAAINAAIEIAKQVMMNALDQVLAPGQSSFGGEMLIGSIKTLLMSGLSIGMAGLTNQLKESFNLVDAKGLSNGTYLVDGKVHTSNALTVGTKFSDSSGNGWGTNLGLMMITGAVNKAGGKVVNLITDSISDGPNAALKKLQGSLKWSDLLDLTVGVAFKDFVSRVQGEMLKDVSTDGTKEERDVTDPKDPTKTIKAKVLKENTDWGANDKLDGTTSQSMTIADSDSSKRHVAGVKLATNLTVVKAMNEVYLAPVNELDAIVENRKDPSTSEMATASGSPVQAQNAIGAFLVAYRACQEAPTDFARARALKEASAQIIGDPYKVEALIGWLVAEHGHTRDSAGTAVLGWIKAVYAWAKKVPPPLPPRRNQPAAPVGAGSNP